MRDGKKTKEWASIAVSDALIDRSLQYRCSECKARVRPHKRDRDSLLASSTFTSSLAARSVRLGMERSASTRRQLVNKMTCKANSYLSG